MDLIWTDMSLADGVLPVAFDGLDLTVLKFDFQAANGFTQVAGDVVGLL